ncbi:energy transducer TonB [Pseudodesulfovibrio piezophilus]|uniref:TonB family protein n=1 Tax=Pseudodesulfovibrio piezophilus (strain DSM 21447 / JCM 15486 / C1TLV30) TaxID=1322246 RepID=M1WJ57_PSEP2|nr:energy transducer TonB [Pseudodesulfovibrio piezophilus]CCH47316.1 TonB family protein [Pseudodesulfovibrio piezophilus C1TLV30]
MILRARGSGDYLAASMVAVMIVGLIYVGVLLLNGTEPSGDFSVVKGAIRIAAEQQERQVAPLERNKEIKEQKPPERLPKTMSSKPKSNTSKPLLSFNVPQFSADMHPSLDGEIALPVSNLGGVGFNMDEVDEVPQVLRQVTPEYPYNAKRNHIEGRVVVRMLVLSNGAPTNLTVQSSEPNGIFDKAALKAAKRWKFKPGHYKGQAVDTWVLLPFNFELTQ